MKKIYTVILIVVLAVLGYILFKGDKTEDSSQNTEVSTYTSVEVGIDFKYPSGPDGYLLEELIPVDLDPDLVRNIILKQTEDTLSTPPVGGEGPPVIYLGVFNNPNKQFPRNWADTHPQYSNINLKTGEVGETTFGGANAIRYMADGLYASDNVVVAHGDNIYVISGQFIDQDSDIRRDFQTILNSVRFIPKANQE